METQQHDGVVVEVAGFQQGFAKRCGRREMCHGRDLSADTCCKSPLRVDGDKEHWTLELDSETCSLEEMEEPWSPLFFCW